MTGLPKRDAMADHSAMGFVDMMSSTGGRANRAKQDPSSKRRPHRPQPARYHSAAAKDPPRTISLQAPPLPRAIKTSAADGPSVPEG
jgi:hypothetical protein